MWTASRPPRRALEYPAARAAARRLVSRGSVSRPSGLRTTTCDPDSPLTWNQKSVDDASLRVSTSLSRRGPADQDHHAVGRDDSPCHRSPAPDSGVGVGRWRRALGSCHGRIYPHPPGMLDLGSRGQGAHPFPAPSRPTISKDRGEACRVVADDPGGAALEQLPGVARLVDHPVVDPQPQGAAAPDESAVTEVEPHARRGIIGRLPAHQPPTTTTGSRRAAATSQRVRAVGPEYPRRRMRNTRRSWKLPTVTRCAAPYRSMRPSSSARRADRRA